MEQQNETLQILRLKGNVSFLSLESLLQISVAYNQFSESRVTNSQISSTQLAELFMNALLTLFTMVCENFILSTVIKNDILLVQ